MKWGLLLLVHRSFSVKGLSHCRKKMKDKASRWLLYASYVLPPCLAFTSFRQWRRSVAQLQRLKLAEENLNRVMEKVRHEVLSDK